MADKILIVDDDLDTLRLVGMILQKNGYEILAARSGQQALDMAQSDNPDLILLDVMMPDLDGVEITRRLRTKEDIRDVPIVMFTAKSQMEDKIEGFEAGVDDYLTKPIQPRELVAHLKAVLARTQKARTVDATIAAPARAEKGIMIGLISARGGLGVSTTALNLGVTLRRVDHGSVIVADFRPGQGTISLELGILYAEGLNRLLGLKPEEITRGEVEKNFVFHPSQVNFLLASAQPHDGIHSHKANHIEAIARTLPSLAEFVILDLSPGLTMVNRKVLQLCDQVIILVEPVPQTLAQTKAFIENMVDIGIGPDRIDVILVNRIRSGMQLSWNQVQEQLGRNISIIFTPAPELAYQASLNNMPIVSQQPESLTAQQFERLAEKVRQCNR